MKYKIIKSLRHFKLKKPSKLNLDNYKSQNIRLIIKNTKKHQKERKQTQTTKKISSKKFNACGTEGCAIYPSFIQNNDNIPNELRVVKIHFTENTCSKEIENYSQFELYDPFYKYHCRIYNSGNILKDTMPVSIHSDISHLIHNFNKYSSFCYVDLEYAGKSIMDINKDDTLNLSLFQSCFIDFLKNVLTLKNNSHYVVNGDPNGTNICYRFENNTYVIKYIDLTEIEIVDEQFIVNGYKDLVSEQIIRQISSFIGNIGFVFGINTPIQSEMSNYLSSLLNMKMRYGDIVKHIITLLSNSDLFVVYEFEERESPPPRQRKSVYRLDDDEEEESKPFPKMRGLLFDNLETEMVNEDDEEDNSGYKKTKRTSPSKSKMRLNF